MTQISNICGASPVNNQIIIFDGHERDFDDLTLIHTEHQNIQPFVLKSGDSINDQTNYIGSNEKLNYIYNQDNYECIMKYGTIKFYLTT